MVGGPPAAQVRAVGCDQAAPDTVLADVPVPQRQLQALGPYGATGADGDRGRCLVAGLGWLDTDRVPLVGVKAAVSAPGLPRDPGPQGIVGQPLAGKAAGKGTASPDDLERKPRRAAAAHQPGDLVPVHVVGDGLGQRPRDPQPGELCHPPFMHEQVVVVDRLMAWSCLRRFHRWGLLPGRFLAITLESPSPGPNPHKLVVLARDLLVVARDLTAAG
jgi:hypothetical protein